MALPRLTSSFWARILLHPSPAPSSGSSIVGRSSNPVNCSPSFPGKQFHGSSFPLGLLPPDKPRIAELKHLRDIPHKLPSQSHQRGLHVILPSNPRANSLGLASLTGKWTSIVPATALKTFLPSANRHFCNFAHEQRTWLQLLISRSHLQQLPSSELGYRFATVRRHLFTQGWAERWESTKVRLKQAVVQQPKVAVRNVIKDAPISNKTRAALSDAVTKPLEGVKNTVSRYKEAVGLQFDAFWRRNYLLLLGAFGFGVCLLLWRIMFGIASMFVGLSERMAKFGFLALAAAMVAFAGLVLRSRYTVNPDKVYRITMRKLHTSAAALEVLGPPLSGTDVRAYVMFGGGLRLKNLRPRLGSKRCFLIFPVRGSERAGLVNVEVKKKKGQYDFKLLALDYTEAGREQKIYLIGDEVEYRVGGGLISELRDPIVKAMTSQKEFDDQDEKEEEDEQRAEEARQKEEFQLLEKQSAKY